MKIGLTKDELELMCKAENVGKVSRRDFAIYVAEGRDGATTVASTMMCCAYAGIQVFATGGIGGVHRHGEVTFLPICRNLRIPTWQSSARERSRYWI